MVRQFFIEITRGNIAEAMVIMGNIILVLLYVKIKLKFFIILIKLWLKDKKTKKIRKRKVVAELVEGQHFLNDFRTFYNFISLENSEMENYVKYGQITGCILNDDLFFKSSIGDHIEVYLVEKLDKDGNILEYDFELPE